MGQVVDFPAPTDRQVAEMVAAMGGTPLRRQRRTFRFRWTLRDAAGAQLFTSTDLDVVDQWDGNSGRACLHLETELGVMLRNGCTLSVSGGYVR